MRRRAFLATSAALLAVPAVVRATSQRVLNFIPMADLAVLDPIVTTTGVTRSHGYPIFDTLYGVTGRRAGPRLCPRWRRVIPWRTMAGPGG
jgi:peptide/nickel transport system substrate-binding protein